MNKKTLIIVVIALLVVGGLYFVANGWLKGRSIPQAFMDTIKGVPQPGLGTGIVTGGGEVVKTPNNLFKETEEVVLSSKTLPFFTENVKPEVKNVFGEAKVTAYGKYSYYEGSFTAELTVPRVITPEDLTKLEEFYAKEGFETTENSVSVGSGTLGMSKNDGTEIEFSYYDFDNQNIRVRYIPVQSEE